MFKGEAKVAQFATYDRKHWLVMAIAPRAEFLAGLAPMKHASIWMILAALGVITGTVWWGTRSVFLNIQGLAGRLAEGAEQSAEASGQVSIASQKLAEGASEQAASLQETSASLEEMTTMTQRNAEHAAQSQRLSHESRAAADRGRERLQEMQGTVEGIKTAVAEMDRVVREMHGSSQEVAKILKTIDEIAFQTNLLALNAAVEAARAGEAGMGFAVVADEVRNLAQRSAAAAKDTASKIQVSLQRSDQSVNESEKVVQRLAEIDATAQKVRAGFNDIVQAINSLDTMMGQITLASKEQSQGITHIQTAVSQLDQVSQNNAAVAEESASAAQELVGQAEAVKQVVLELRQMVDGHRGPATGSPPSAPNVAATGAESSNLIGPMIVKPYGAGNGRRILPQSETRGVVNGVELQMEGDFKHS